MNAILTTASNLGFVPLFASNLAVTTLIHYLILSGAILLVTGGVMLWALKFRKRRRERKHRHHPSPARRDAATQSAMKSEAAPSSSKRRRRRSEPPRNPTLAETRGLPPVREEPSRAAEHYQH